MKQKLLTKSLLLLTALLGGVSSVWAAAGDPTTLPTTNGTCVTLDKSVATISGTINNTTETTGEYGSIKEGGTLLFKLTNTVEQKYTVSMQLATQNNGSSCDVQILASDQSTIEYSTTISIYNSGYWSNWFQYAFTTSGNVTTGDKYLKIIFHHTTSGAFVCNGKSITITAGTKTGTTNVVEIPATNNTAYTFTLNEKVTYTSNTSTGTDVPNKKTSGTTTYFDNYGSSGTVAYALYNATNQYYTISFNGATTNSNSSFTVIVLNESGTAEVTKEFAITNNNNWTQFDEGTLYSYTTSNALSAGNKTLILKFTNVNVANLTFTPSVAATQYTVTTSASPAAGGVVSGAGDYDAGTNVVISQKAKWGYQFSSWTVNDAAAGSTSSYTISSIAANTTVVGNFSVNDGIFQTIPTTSGSYLDLTLANPDLAENGKPTASYLDNYRSNEQTQFALRSTITQRYAVSFKTARNNDGNTTVTFSFATKAAPETTVFTKEVTIANNGNWTDFANSYSFYTDELAAGDWIMTLTFGNTGTTCNMKDFVLVPYQTLDESTNYTAVAATDATITLTRTLPANKWATIVLPFNVTVKQAKETFGDDVKLAQLTGITSENMQFSSVDMTTDENATAMNANEPYMIYVPEGLSEAKTINGVTIVEGTPSKTTVSGIDFIGSYDALTNIPASDGSNKYYFVSDNKLWKTAASGTADTMQGTRAYFKVPGTSAARLRGFVIDSNNTTGISSVATTSQRTEEDYYDLQGRRVKSPKRGLYIVNGKKMVVK